MEGLEIMRELAGKTAFVTGGASGIGLALGRAFAEAGMKVMLADIEANALKGAVDSLRNVGPEVRGVTFVTLPIPSASIWPPKHRKMRLGACMWSATMLALAEVGELTTSHSIVGDGC
jgi:NAD(P)-dependent dehydrogenase (short-subunit alcohol dehydrogenase family)